MGPFARRRALTGRSATEEAWPERESWKESGGVGQPLGGAQPRGVVLAGGSDLGPHPRVLSTAPAEGKGEGRREGKWCSVERGGRSGKQKRKGNRNMAVCSRDSLAAGSA